MSQGTLLIIAGGVIFLAGIAKIGGGFSLKNFGLNFGGAQTQNIKLGNVKPEAKIDWSGITIAVIGLLTAIVGVLK